MTSKNNLQKCRACLVPQNAVSYDMRLLPLVAHKFYTCTAISMEEEDSLPGVLCGECNTHLEQFYAFRERCIAADAQLRAEKDENLQTKPCEDEIKDNEEVSRLRSTARKRRVRKPSQEVEDPANPVSQPVTEQSSCYKCDICDSRFLVEHRLQAHKRQHEGLTPYPCTETGCERGFNRMHCLSEHLKQHSGTNRWFNCDQEGCSKRYRHKPTLIMHMRRSHKLGPELKSHVCEFCGKVFNSSAVLNDHRYTHKDKSELPHACSEPQCPRRFASKEKLKVHLLRHAGIKNFSCPYCGMRKTTRNELKIHMNYHTLERTWPCRFCSKVCNSSGNLKMHVRTVHERARDYACSYCERSFAKPDTRKYHEMTHTGEKPNECEECGKRFTQPAALRTHRKIHERQRKEADANLTIVVAPSTPAADNS
ncbi:zinc finger protein 883-like [Drosophila sulfurigaster albostrigata]|uniref:zinc finger protein 883-like n=1 Tax=Drosophila sulfurigaster albostrigata TaxID=89887 RepID=UPI002D218873|nr:zinc finger protein 883-like [Drosophila sulfurigaster albostrigata]